MCPPDATVSHTLSETLPSRFCLLGFMTCSPEMHILLFFPGLHLAQEVGDPSFSQLLSVATLGPVLKPEPVKALGSLDLVCERETECKRLENKPIFPVNACRRVWFCLARGYDGMFMA